jgi:hypothetical protein
MMRCELCNRPLTADEIARWPRACRGCMQPERLEARAMEIPDEKTRALLLELIAKVTGGS